MVIVPTAGAARAVRRGLARQAGGVLVPAFKLPMEAVLGEERNIASPLERAAAWVLALRGTRREKFATLVPAAVKLSRPEDWLGVGSRLMTVCDALAEGGWHPGSPALAEHSQHDARRWKEFAALHASHTEILRSGGREDPNMRRLQSAQDGTVPEGITRIFVALVPDLPAIVSDWLEKVSATGVAVEVLAWNCGDDAARFDDWGRPDPVWWSKRTIDVPGEVIVAENNTALEADALVDFAARSGPGGFTIVSADDDSTSALEAEFSKRGRNVYLPAGIPLSRTEAATILAGWEAFVRGHNLHALGPLLQLPAFLRYFADTTGFPAVSASAACDVLVAAKLCRTVEDAQEWSAGNRSGPQEDELPLKFVAAITKLTEAKISGRELLGEIYGDAEAVDEETAEELEALVTALGEPDPILQALPPEWQEALARDSVARSRVFHPAPEHAVEISGWLEAPWTDAKILGVAGCREGALPAGTTEDAFLPDSLRAKLGLADNASRYARDAYLLSCLLRCHGSSGLRLAYGRFRSGGEPNRPSRLLLGCPDQDLPERVEKVFQPSPARVRPPAASREWKLRLDSPPRVESMRVTGFKHYLGCPLRFYLSQVRRLQSFDPEAGEIGAADYGTLLHRVVENLHKHGPADSTDSQVIATFFDEELERVAACRFGRDPLPVVRVQIESMRQRLRHLATVQAAERRAGWIIIESEYAVKKEAGLRIGSLALTGTMDRVEAHPELGLRILDYKTFAKAKNPEETHFGRPRADENLPAADITRENRAGRQVRKSWIDLQLPLYRHMAAQIWVDYPQEKIQAGYLLLPGDPDETQTVLLGLDEEAQRGALRCAEEVADRVQRGVFWPPSAAVDYDDFASWFGGADPAAVFDDATIARLEGRP